MVIVFFIGTSLFFLLYTDIIQYKHIKQLCTQFVYEVAKDGILTESDYYIFMDALSEHDTSIEFSLSHMEYDEIPYYSFCTEEESEEYFSKRNVLSVVNLPLLEIQFPDIEPDKLVLQDKTNANVLASLSSDSYAPLPEDDVTSAAFYTAVCDEQKVYEGEKLCTVVKVVENGVTYYAVADEAIVEFTGTYVYEPKINGVPTGTEITVTSHPRTITCSHNHETLVTMERIEEYEQNGTYGPCTFCAMVPADITSSRSAVSAQVGTEMSSLGVTLTVTYQDGHTEGIDLSDRELFTSYDSSYYGEQQVRFSYKGLEKEVFTCTLYGGACSVCGSECTEKNIADYERFPYCSVCMEQMPLYRGETYSQKEYIDNDTIVLTLLNDKVYYFERGDYVELFLSYKGESRAIPFLAADIKMPIVIGESVRTDGKRD